jgi:5,5'-dehydrodivanillate O-demethylase oxygenase subunit
MLSADDNRRLTEVGPGTPMGALLRRYWMPIGAVAELEESSIKPVRLLGEDLVLYKDRGGRYGLVQRNCLHRGADLSYGMVEEHGLRCSYHGWLYDERGRCLAQPFEQRVNPGSQFRERLCLKAYVVQAYAGLLWGYLGPAPAPALPSWRNFSRKGYKHVSFTVLPANWLQCMENSFDQVHNEWLHDKWSFYTRDGAVPPDRWRVRAFKHREFEHGWAATVEYEGHEEEFPDRIILWPNYNYISLFEWYVPIDDTHTLYVLWHNVRFRAEAPFKQDRIPYWTGVVSDPVTQRLLMRPPRNQDVIVWTGQGRIADRTKEHLGVSDTGIIMFRKALFRQMEIVEAGADPKGVVRDAAHYFVMLPEPVPSGPNRDGLPGALSTPADMRTITQVAGCPGAILDEIQRISTDRGEQALLAKELKSGGWKAGGKSVDVTRHFAALRLKDAGEP